MANESGSDENLCFFITRIGEEGSPEREQADGVLDLIVRPAPFRGPERPLPGGVVV